MGQYYSVSTSYYLDVTILLTSFNSAYNGLSELMYPRASGLGSLGTPANNTNNTTVVEPDTQQYSKGTTQSKGTTHTALQ